MCGPRITAPVRSEQTHDVGVCAQNDQDLAAPDSAKIWNFSHDSATIQHSTLSALALSPT